MTSTGKKKDHADALETREERPSATPSHPDQARLARPAISSMDLSIEEVEERITPSETNVFDK